MKKIALLHYAYSPNIGGVESLIKEQANILSDMGYNIKIIVGSGKEDNPRIELIEDSIFQSILRYNSTLQEKIISGGKINEEFYRLSAVIENKVNTYLSDCDAIIIHNMLTLVHNLPFIDAFKKFVATNPDKRIIVWVHDQTFIDEEKVVWAKQGVRLHEEAKKILLEPVNKAIYVVISDTFYHILSQVMDLSNNKILVIPNGINIKKFLEIEDSIWQVVNKENLLKIFPIILSPFNILPRKNIEYCLEIIYHLKKRYSNIKYLISGKASTHRSIGNYFELLLKKIVEFKLEKNVIFLDKYFNNSLSDAEMHDLYDLADIVFYFSKSENFGLPILESYLSKTPIFVSNLKVFHEIGRENLSYRDCLNILPEKIAIELSDFLENNQIIKMNKLVRQKYNLQNIIEEKLIPLL